MFVAMVIVLEEKPMHIGCKHLEYDESKYPSCKLITIEPDGWKYWERPKYYDGQRTRVQFCRKRGRINEIFACINPGEMPCFEANQPPPLS